MTLSYAGRTLPLQGLSAPGIEAEGPWISRPKVLCAPIMLAARATLRAPRWLIFGESVILFMQGQPVSKRYFVRLAEHLRIRVSLEVQKNRVVNLVVQLEIFIEGWVPVVRYNYAHGFPHRDLLLADGGKLKEPVEGRDLGRIATQAIEDLKKNWPHYLRRCGYEAWR